MCHFKVHVLEVHKGTYGFRALNGVVATLGPPIKPLPVCLAVAPADLGVWLMIE
jgi:hypothetical protein